MGRSRVAAACGALLPVTGCSNAANEPSPETRTAGPTPAIAMVGLAAAEFGVACSRPGFANAAVTVPPPPGRKLPGWTRRPPRL